MTATNSVGSTHVDSNFVGPVGRRHDDDHNDNDFHYDHDSGGADGHREAPERRDVDPGRERPDADRLTFASMVFTPTAHQGQETRHDHVQDR